jgi:uncharacterized membrane protein (UPF0127 family)
MARFVAVLAIALVAGACTRPSTGAPVGGTVPKVVLTVGSGVKVEVKVELARTEPERARGLMYRRSLDPGSGMLFIFPAPDYLKFWMRQTYIPLDMIFFGADKKVVYVEENAEPLNDTPRGPPDTPSQYVLEVPGGWARAHGILPGVTADFVGVM